MESKYAILTIETDDAKDMLKVMQALDDAGLIERVKISVPPSFVQTGPFSPNIFARDIVGATTWGTMDIGHPDQSELTSG